MYRNQGQPRSTNSKCTVMMMQALSLAPLWTTNPIFYKWECCKRRLPRISDRPVLTFSILLFNLELLLTRLTTVALIEECERDKSELVGRTREAVEKRELEPTLESTQPSSQEERTLSIQIYQERRRSMTSQQCSGGCDVSATPLFSHSGLHSSMSNTLPALLTLGIHWAHRSWEFYGNTNSGLDWGFPTRAWVWMITMTTSEINHRTTF